MFLIVAIIALLMFLGDPVGFFGLLLCAGAIALAAFVTVALACGAWVVLS